MRVPSTAGAAASNVIVHIGVGTPSPPDGKTSFIVSAVPESTPSTVPVLNLWHDPHDPSAALSGARSAVPESVEPLCARRHVMRSSPCGSEPVPFHVPASVSAAGAGAGAAGDGAQPAVDARSRAAGDGPQPAVDASSSAAASSRAVARTIIASIDPLGPRECRSPGDSSAFILGGVVVDTLHADKSSARGTFWWGPEIYLLRD